MERAVFSSLLCMFTNYDAVPGTSAAIRRSPSITPETIMPFSLTSYLLGVGTVAGALAFGFGGGILLTNTAMKESPTRPTRVERVARSESRPPAAPPQAANALVAKPKENPAPPVAPAAAHHTDPVPAVQAEAPKPNPRGEPQGSKEPATAREAEQTKQAEPAEAEHRRTAAARSERQKRYALRRSRENAASRTKPREVEAQDEPEVQGYAVERPEPGFDIFRVFNPPSFDDGDRGD
jgi:hypothetical protein